MIRPAGRAKMPEPADEAAALSFDTPFRQRVRTPEATMCGGHCGLTYLKKRSWYWSVIFLSQPSVRILFTVWLSAAMLSSCVVGWQAM